MLMLLLFSGALLPVTVSAKCRWLGDTGLHAQGNMLRFDAAAFCDSGDSGALKASFIVGNKTVDTNSKKWSTYTAGPGRVRILPAEYAFKLFSNRACPKDYRPTKRAKYSNHGYGYKDYVVAEQPVRLELRGEGALKALNRDVKGVFLCRACVHLKGSSSKYDARVREGRFVARAGRAWFECARRASTVEIRLFSGKDKQNVTNAYKPQVVIKKVLKKFRAKGQNYTLDMKLPIAKLCAQGEYWGWELEGTGELKSMSGGGRMVTRCK